MSSWVYIGVVCVCFCILLTISIGESDSVQDCESKGPNLGENWYQSISDERAQPTIVEENRRNNCKGISEATDFVTRANLVKSF